jgi:diaminopimelate decarboxylase
MHSTERQSYRLAGPICSPGDVLYWACSLPSLETGDKLVITDAGAYFVPFATSFSFPQPAIVMLDEGKERLIRRAERFEDLIALDAY